MKYIFILLGVFCFIIGVIGIILPLIPTTPLFLLTLICFAKSSPKLEKRFISSKFYKKYLEDFMKNKRLPLKRKIFLVCLATTMMSFPLIILDNIIIKILVVMLLAYIYYYFFFKIKNY